MPMTGAGALVCANAALHSTTPRRARMIPPRSDHQIISYGALGGQLVTACPTSFKLDDAQMKILLNRVMVAMALASIPAALLAQWPDYPTARVARTPDGKPKLDAAAPRTADGKPDLSGIWLFR